jgi:hypothetical protein
MNARGEYGNQGRQSFIGPNPPPPHQESAKRTSWIAAAVGVGVVGLGLLWFRKYKAMMLHEMKEISPGADLMHKYPALGEDYKAQQTKILRRLE